MKSFGEFVVHAVFVGAGLVPARSSLKVPLTYADGNIEYCIDFSPNSLLLLNFLKKMQKNYKKNATFLSFMHLYIKDVISLHLIQCLFLTTHK